MSLAGPLSPRGSLFLGEDDHMSVSTTDNFTDLKNLSPEAVRNIAGFFDLLAEWDREDREKTRSDNATKKHNDYQER